MSDILSVGQADFQTQVLEESLPVVVDFWAAWCGPCQMFAPVVEAIAKTYQDKLKLVRVNVDEQPELAEQFEVESIPTLVLIRGGETVDTLMGALPQHAVEKWLKDNQAV